MFLIFFSLKIEIRENFIISCDHLGRLMGGDSHREIRSRESIWVLIEMQEDIKCCKS